MKQSAKTTTSGAASLVATRLKRPRRRRAAAARAPRRGGRRPARASAVRRESVDERRDGARQAREAAEVADRARQRRHALARAQLREPLDLERRHVDAGGALRSCRPCRRRRCPGPRASSAASGPSSVSAPHRMPCSTLARARVLRLSSRVAAAGGHIVPLSFLHRPAPKHFSIARSNAALGAVGEPRPPGAVGAVLGPEAQMVGHGAAVEDDARRKQSIGVEGVLERDEGGHELGTEELGQEPRARAAAAVLAGDGAVVLAHQAPDVVRQRVHAGDAGRRLEVEQRPDVQAAGGGMPGERGARAVLGDDALEVGDEGAQALRGDGGVLDERGRPLGTRRAHEQRQDGTAQGAGLGERGGVGQVGDLDRAEARRRRPAGAPGLRAPRPRRPGTRRSASPAPRQPGAAPDGRRRTAWARRAAVAGRAVPPRTGPSAGWRRWPREPPGGWRRSGPRRRAPGAAGPVRPRAPRTAPACPRSPPSSRAGLGVETSSSRRLYPEVQRVVRGHPSAIAAP